MFEYLVPQSGKGGLFFGGEANEAMLEKACLVTGGGF